MKTEIVIFVLFSTLAQRSCTGESHSSSPSDIEIDYFTIGSSEKKVLRENDKSFNFLFGTLAKLVNVSLGIQEELEHDSSKPEEIDNAVFHKLSTGLSATIYAIQIIQPDPSADPTRWDLVKQKLKEVVESTTSAVSMSMNSCTSLAEIEIIENRVTNKALEICENYYNSMAIGRFKQTAVMNALRGSQKKALSHVGVVFQSIFSAIQILHEINSSKVKVENKRVLASIEFLRKLTSETLMSEAGVRYDSLYTIYATDLVAEPKIATRFSALQSMENKQIDYWLVIVDTVWNALHEIDETENTSLRIKAARDKVFSTLTKGFAITINVLETIRINNSYEIEVDKRVVGWQHDIADGVFDALEKVARQNSSGNPDDNNAKEKKVYEAFSSIGSSIFDITSNISINRTDITAAIKNVGELTTSYLRTGFRIMFDEFRLAIARKSSNDESRNTSLFYRLDAKNVAFYYLKMQSQYRSGLFRKLYESNSLYNYGIDVEYSFFDTFPSQI